ncbi:hypothetical protein OS493_033392 [Desmophyllum pertusum]|uniref:Sushi, von Willebrand factor type A, EGF and pentraxin domain-containing protein 1-like n=1 Tax=Desmophyllum pertusum TaxID=174260 RepID=A0A9X0CI93_9CNID|nr:hypothetical protein OS493_033392 [Desmophyllum pertusum]
MDQSINGYLTNMKDAFELAWQVCLNNGLKRSGQIKTVVILLTDGYWNQPWNDPSPLARAKDLLAGKVEIFAIGVGSVNFPQLQSLVSDPDKHAFKLKDFTEFGELATYIRGDPYEAVWQVDGVDPSKCDNNCDVKAQCACGLVYGDYKCGCFKGYAGSGLVGQCHECTPSTYKDFDGYAPTCTACPANSGHQLTGSKTILDCKCFTGYSGKPENGEDCTIRNCETLVAPANGKITGHCYRTYGSSCTFECSEGYEITGTATRTCTVKAGDIMDWSGTTVTCTVIRCPIQTVINADPPTGTCTDPSPVYRTDCSYACRTGYNIKGSKKITCQLDKNWSPAAPTCEQVTCPALPKAAVGTYYPATCDDGESPYPTTCELRCPSGYHISYLPTSIISDQRTCELNGTWEYRASTPTCKDTEPPVVGNCPSDINIDNATSSTIRVNWERPTCTDNSGIPPIVTSNKQSGALFAAPSTAEVLYTVSDDGGNENKNCSFRITIKMLLCATGEFHMRSKEDPMRTPLVFLTR